MRRKSRFILIGVVASVLLRVSLLWAQDAPVRLSLADALRLAEEHSPVLQAARQQVTSAQADVDKARAGFLPKLDIQEQFARSDNPTFAFSSKLNQGSLSQNDLRLPRLVSPTELNNFQTSFALSQPLYSGGSVRAGFAQAKLTAQANEYGLQRQTQEVLFQVTRAYYGILLAQEQLRVVQAGVQTAEANARLAQDRFVTGLVVESDALSAQVRLASLTEQSITATHQVTLASSALNDAIGLPLEESWSVHDQFDQRPHSYTQLATLQEVALTQRPDYQQLAAEEQAEEWNITRARAAFLPILSATVRYDINNADFTAHGQDSWFVGAVLQWNLFNGGGDAAQLAAARAHHTRLRALRARHASAIRLEVQEAFFSLRTAEERIGVARTAVTQAEASVRIVNDRYQAGLTTIVDLLGTETALTQARERLTHALYEYHVGLAQLELAMGTLRHEPGSGTK